MSDKPVTVERINELLRERFANIRADVQEYQDERIKQEIEGIHALAAQVPGLEIKVEETGEPGHLKILIKVPKPAEFIKMDFGEEK